ncbi:MAG TPA: hypothetical protein VJQ43_03970 [Thermoplasmata archaeon]|nr:hypothetical protein [Thermoplasmata archaeon]
MSARGLPPEGEQLLTAVAYQFRFYLRTWRFLGLALIIAAITAVFATLTFYNGVDAVKLTSPTAASYLGTSLTGIAPTVAIVCAFFGGDAVAMDFGSANGYFALVLPVRRPILLLGRYIAAAGASFVVVLIYWGSTVASAEYVYGSLPAATLASLGLVVLLILAVLSLAFFMSALFSKPIIAIVVTVLLVVIAFPILTAGLAAANIEPLFVINYAGEVVGNVFLSLPHAHSTVVGGSGGNGSGTVTFTNYNPILWQGTAVMAAYFVVFLGLAVVLHVYKEVKG